MHAFTQLVGIAALASSALLPRVAADVVPTAPGPGDSFNEGSPCTIQWNLDTTGSWTNFTVQLMTGSNQAMTPLTTVLSGVDGTTGTGKYEWTCPEVTPNSAIYFYQFTQAGAQTSWTTRFTIASATGETTEPTETVMVDGKPVGWGTGRLSGASVSPSSGGSASASTGGSAQAGSSSLVASSPASSSAASPSGMTTVTTTSSVQETTSTSSSSSSSSSSVSSVISSRQPSVAAQSSTPVSGASTLSTSYSVLSATALLAVASLAILA
ncbi:hypothetical protein JCM16303_000027 [Sporobolomyces ruberrimus]